MPTLFDNDPAFCKVEMGNIKLGNHKGQFCTKEQKRIENIEHENRVLRIKAETYLHNWLAVGKKATKVERENLKLKDIIKMYEQRQ